MITLNYISMPAKTISAITNINISWRSINFSINNPILWIGITIAVFIFLRLWGIKKFISFCLLISVLLFLMMKVDKFIVNFFGKDEGQYFTLLAKPIFVFIIAFVFIYYTFIQKD